MGASGHYITKNQSKGRQCADESHVVSEHRTGHKDHKPASEQRQPRLPCGFFDKVKSKDSGKGAEAHEKDLHREHVRTRDFEQARYRVKPQQIVTDKHVSDRPPTFENS